MALGDVSASCVQFEMNDIEILSNKLRNECLMRLFPIPQHLYWVRTGIIVDEAMAILA